MPPWWRVSTEIAYFAALAAVIGGAVAYLTIVRPVLRTDVDEADGRAVHTRTVRLLAWCGPVLLVAGYLQLAARVARGVKGVTFGQSLAPSRIWSFLTLPIAVQNVCYALAGLTLLTLFRWDRPTLVTAVALPLTVLGTVVLALPDGKAQTLDTQLNGCSPRSTSSARRSGSAACSGSPSSAAAGVSASGPDWCGPACGSGSASSPWSRSARSSPPACG